MKLYDTHIHSHHSHDGSFSVVDLAEEALKRGLNGICITDHFDGGQCKSEIDYEHISASVEEAKKAALIYEGRLEIFSGVELGDYPFGKEAADNCLKNLKFDFVLNSIHAGEVARSVLGKFNGFATLNDDEIHLFMSQYFEVILKNISELEFDSLAHLTYPMRYIVAVCKRSLNISLYKSKIEEILYELIKKQKSLEVNTSCFATDWKHTLPDYDIISNYYKMGGRLITIGSDAHMTERIGLGIQEVGAKLKEIGFENYYIYKNRTPVAVSL